MEKLAIFIKKNRVKIIQLTILLGAFVVLVEFMNHRIDNLIDSDMASQLVLSNLLAEEKGILSTNWFYATEVRVFSLQLIFTPLFMLTSNWHVVRIAGNIILYLILLASIYYFCRQLKIEKKFWILGTVFLLPFSDQYFRFVLNNVNYVPCMAISFFAIGMTFNYVNSEKKLKKIILFFLIGMIALLSGLNGMRQLFVTYAPLVLSSLIAVLLLWKNFNVDSWRKFYENDKVKLLFINIWSVVVNLIGYLVNSKYLSQKYDYTDYEEIIKWDSFSITDLASIVNGWMLNLGFSSGKLLSVSILYNFVSLVLLGVSIYAIIVTFKHQEKSSLESLIMGGFVLGGFVISVALYCFTSMGYEARYELPITSFCFTCIVLFMTEGNLSKRYKKMLFTVIAVGLCASSIGHYISFYNKDSTSEFKKIINVLKEGGYENGYATFWQANVVEELSNGSLELWNWQRSADDFLSVNQIFKWAQVKRHEYEHPDGKVFWILTDEENKNFHITKNVGDNYVLYTTSTDEIDRYIVYGFSSYDEMISVIANYNFDFYTNNNVFNGMDYAGKRYLSTNGISFGPYITLYPGRYAISCSGEGLDNLTFDSIYLDEEKSESSSLEIVNVDKNTNEIYYEIEIPEEINHYEARFFNNSDEEVILSKIAIKWIGRH